MTFARTARSCFVSLCATLLAVALSACAGGTGNTTLPRSQQGTSALTTQQMPTPATTAFSHFRYHLYPIHNGAAAAMKTQAINYPADLQYFGGAVVTSAVDHNVYVDCQASCWGDPQQFLDNLNDSTLIHVVDQYVHQTANYRYRFGYNYAATVNFASSNMMSNNQIINVVHLAALRFGGGYHNVYNVFLPAGVDTSIASSQCYSPDQSQNWTFCAYHSSVDFSDKAGHVLYTVEPYQEVPGCTVSNPTNSLLADSTDSTLSHEHIETITDPDPDSAWFNANFNDEVADLCASYDDSDLLYSRKYTIQEFYSNQAHACVN